MKRSGPLKRNTRLRPVSRKTAAARTSPEAKRERDEYERQKRRVSGRSGGLCEVRAEGCTGAATDPHHVWRRGRSLRDPGPLVAPTDADLLHLCRQCHVGFIHNDESGAAELGLIARSLDQLTEGRALRPRGVPR